MTASLIPLHSDAHQEVQELLPWYCTGQIDPADRAKVDAHLGGCAACQAEMRVEMRLSTEVAALPLELELGWLDLRRRLSLRARRWPRIRSWLGRLWERLSSREYAHWGVAAQVSLLLVFVVLISAPTTTAHYHTLGTQDIFRAGNVIAMFNPEAEEGDVRRSLSSAGARVVDGPTPAGAYVLFVDPDHRSTALAMLRADVAVLMAEPLDEGSQE